MNFDDIITNSNNKEQNFQKPFDKEEWAKKKQEERQGLYDLADKTAEEIKSDHVKFKQYLNVQAQFDKYSVNNALLISAKMPSATQIKEYDDWRKQKAFVKKNPVWIKILEPGDTYTRTDGTIATSYNPKRMLDISQTNAKPREQQEQYDDKAMLKAFLQDCPVDISAVDELPNGKGADWNKDDNVLYIRRGLESPAIFNALSMELAKVGLEESQNRELDNFKSYCVSYLVCKKHGIDVSSYKFDNLPSELNTMEVGEIKNTLGDIRGTMEDINNRMASYFESISRTQKNKDYER